jgi:hypothetical protein
MTPQKAVHGKGWRQGLVFHGKGGRQGLVIHGKRGHRGLVLCRTLWDSVSPTVSGVSDKKQVLLKCTCPHWMWLGQISFMATRPQQYRKFQTKTAVTEVHMSFAGPGWAAFLFTVSSWQTA